ncbi:MAG TPA: hypothetical protein VHM00_09645 [Caldimonas sp.]|nr:hypothetical protein [Caldimonas sp.]HEX2541330.1 hypothetical protein [Caldimonas sp.]
MTTPASSSTPSAADNLAAKANVAYQSASQAVREQTDAVVKRIQPQIDAVSSYARNEPTKAMLMSAAAGAALMGIVALLVRSGGSSRPDMREMGSTASAVAGSTLSAIREAALDLADRAHSVAQNALDSTHKRAAEALGAGEKRASDTLGSTQKRAADAAESVSDTVAEAWQSLRDQAAPVVDKLRPQFEAAANYAKDEPARAALGIAAAGAVLIGLMALIRNSGSDSDPYTDRYADR